MYILVEVVYCRPYSYTQTGYLLSNKSFVCKCCRDLCKAWRWICRKQQKSDFYISFTAYFCSENGITAISSIPMSREIANIYDYEFCKKIYDIARDVATCEYLCADFQNQFDDFDKIF